ncbi:hypothetical protein EDB81DRAFT_763819 [Dactylonectria macrodidyma]|uniref:Uncharacterized protein n=1 Tax=Dactylonectria macrodidyma TaxID=307937 RepID=A0A9P9IQA7_9HYPO|nr:hypothetical protein EDB81DRAFT_763819 [Dactylonectria macrodidyma]
MHRDFLGSHSGLYGGKTEGLVWVLRRLLSLRCLVSIGTGVPAKRPVRDDVLGIGATLKKLATETETTAEQFRRDKSSLEDEGTFGIAIKDKFGSQFLCKGHEERGGCEF